MDPSLALATSAAIAAALASMIGAFVTAYFGFKATRQSNELATKTSEIDQLHRKLDNCRRELVRTYRQLAAYCEVETVAAVALASGQDKAPVSVKSSLRKAARENGVEPPDSTRLACEKRIGELGGEGVGYA